ncbi:MAG TPA: hypothetical protein VLX92_09515 [Kofleriaceae bacterium]|nr:hypothetical protein [Kofleriaceae bacterium]
MKWIALALALGACQRGESGSPAKKIVAPPEHAPVTDAYKADIGALCDCVRLSGADKIADDGSRAPIIAMWLGSNLHTKEAHDFLVAIQPLEGEPKATALESEAHRVGLPGCALAAEWRK